MQGIGYTWGVSAAMALRLCRREEFEALVLGTAAYAAGGGGSKERAWMLYTEAFLSRGRCLEVLGLDEVSGVVVSPYFLGALQPGGTTSIEAISRALTLLGRIGVEASAVMPVELGAGNTAAAFYAGAMMTLPAVDGDRVGRAAPEVHQDTAVLHGVKLTPSVICSGTGLCIVVHDYGSVDEYEEIARHTARITGGSVFVVDAPMPAHLARRIAIAGTISRAVEVGKAVLGARQRGMDPVKALAEAMGGWIVFEGVVERVELRVEGGFLRGWILVRGTGSFRGHMLRSMVKNEHIAVWLDDQPLVLPPDLFTLVAPDGEPLLNTELKPGMRVYGVAAPAPEVWRTEQGLQLFGPQHFGINTLYQPVENLVRRLGLA